MGSGSAALPQSGLGERHWPENVLTTEVFAALDFLPRDAFLGDVIRTAQGASEAARSTVAAAAEDSLVTVLPGDIQPRFLDGSATARRVQPDVIIEPDHVCCLVEAKRIRPSSFQRDQLMRTLLALRAEADGRTPLLLLVLGQPPPIAVGGAGRMDLGAAVGMALAGQPDDERSGLTRLAADALAWTTWTDIADVARSRVDHYKNIDRGVRGSIQRLARSVTDAVDRHS